MEDWIVEMGHVVKLVPVHRAVIFQYGCDKNRPLLCFVFLFSDLKLHRPQIKVEVIEAELWSPAPVQPVKNYSMLYDTELELHWIIFAGTVTLKKHGKTI